MGLALDEVLAADCDKDEKTTSLERYIDIEHGVYRAYLTHI
jgi:hypothetical protein